MKSSMDWILEEVLEELKTLKGITENRIHECSAEEDKFKDALGSNDKFEVGKHEYWRGRMLEAIETKDKINELIISIYEMINEEAKSESDYSEHMRQLKAIGRGYIREYDDPEPTGGLWSTETGDVY